MRFRLHQALLKVQFASDNLECDFLVMLASRITYSITTNKQFKVLMPLIPVDSKSMLRADRRIVASWRRKSIKKDWNYFVSVEAHWLNHIITMLFFHDDKILMKNRKFRRYCTFKIFWYTILIGAIRGGDILGTPAPK